MSEAKLTCGVAEDLMPLYLEGLTGEESKRAMETHLTGCPGCRARLEALGAPMTAVEPPPEPPKAAGAVVRRAERRARLQTALFFVLIVALAMALPFLLERFYGLFDPRPVPSGDIRIQSACLVPARESGASQDQVLVLYTLTGDYHGRFLSQRTGTGAWTLYYTPFSSSRGQDDAVGFFAAPVTEGSRAVTLNGETVWTEGAAPDAPVPEYAAAIVAAYYDGSFYRVETDEDSVTLTTGAGWRTWRYDGTLLDSGRSD